MPIIETKKKCSFIKPDGEKCEAWAMADSEFCYFHNPDISETEKKEIQSKGGQANKIKVLEPLEPITLKEGGDVILLLEDTINKVRTGEIDLKVANCIGYLAGHLMKAIETTKLEGRVEIIERVILEKRKSYRY
jgi:hypothetical protein